MEGLCYMNDSHCWIAPLLYAQSQKEILHNKQRTVDGYAFCLLFTVRYSLYLPRREARRDS